MTPNSDPGRLGQRWREATRPASTVDCPPAAALERLARGTTPLGGRATLLEHVAGCAACGAAMAALDALQAHESALAAAAPPRGHATFWLAVAAAVVLAIGSALWLPRFAAPPASDPVLRGAVRGEALEPQAHAELDAPPARLRWRGDVAAPVRVRLLDASARALWTSDPLGVADVVLPEPIRAQLEPGGAYAWEVVPAHGDAAALGPFWFSVRR